MKLQVDFDNKKITLVDSCPAGKLMETLEKLFPDGKWAEFTIETSSVINWQSPIIIKEKVYPDWPYNPFQPIPVWYGGTGDVVRGTTTDQVLLKSNYPSGTHNIQFE